MPEIQEIRALLLHAGYASAVLMTILDVIYAKDFSSSDNGTCQ